MNTGSSSRFLVLACLFTAIAGGFASERSNLVTAVHIPGAKAVIKALADSAGTIHVFFDADDGPQYTKSIDSGVTFGKPMSIVDAASQRHGLKFSAADMAIGKGGRVHVGMSNNAWKLKLPQEEWSLYYATLAPGAKEFSPVRNLNRKPSEGFSLAADENGNVTACFLSGKLFSMTSGDDGTHFSEPREIDSTWNPCDCCTTSAAYGPDGQLTVIYREETNNDRDMFVIVSDAKADSKPVRRRLSGTPWNYNACPMTYYTINRTPTGYVAAWPTKGEVYFARLDQDGRVLPRGEIKTAGRTGMRTGVAAVNAPDGATLVTWKNNQVLGWQLYDVKGEPHGAAGSIASPGTGAAAVALSNGGFLVFP